MLFLSVLLFGCTTQEYIPSISPFCPLGIEEPDPSLSAPTGFPEEEIYEAKYNGYQDGKHRFIIKGSDRIFELANDGDYRLQNLFKKGRQYTLSVKGDTVMEAYEKEGPTDDFSPAVSGTPGQATLKNLLATALSPVGSTLYIYGGGWNWQDAGASNEAKSIGIASDWREFFNVQDGTYSYSEGYFPHNGVNEYRYAGLDCSGYLGWVIYNVAHDSDGENGYVVPSTEFATSLASEGWGAVSNDISKLHPGDIVSINGHVWLVIGVCEDGSIVISHSTPSPSRLGEYGGGVQLSAIGDSKSCEAYLLVDMYMSRYYPNWYERYAPVLVSYSDYMNFNTAGTGVFTWNVYENGFLRDPDGFLYLSAGAILESLYGAN